MIDFRSNSNTEIIEMVSILNGVWIGGFILSEYLRKRIADLDSLTLYPESLLKELMLLSKWWSDFFFRLD